MMVNNSNTINYSYEVSKGTKFYLIGAAILAIGTAGLVWGIVIAQSLPISIMKCVVVFSASPITIAVGVCVYRIGKLKYGGAKVSMSSYNESLSLDANHDSKSMKDYFSPVKYDSKASKNTKAKTSDASSDESDADITDISNSKMFNDFCYWYRWNESPRKWSPNTCIAICNKLAKKAAWPKNYIQVDNTYTTCSRIMNRFYRWHKDPETYRKNIFEFNVAVAQKKYEMSQKSIWQLLKNNA